jgi:hypothetical protein
LGGSGRPFFAPDAHIRRAFEEHRDNPRRRGITDVVRCAPYTP